VSRKHAMGKLRSVLAAALLALTPSLAWGQLGPSPGNITTPQATDLVPLYGRGTTGPLFGPVSQLFGTSNPIIGVPAGTITFPTNAENFVNLTGGAIGASGIPRLLFQSTTPITPPNNTLVGFGTSNQWPFGDTISHTYSGTDYQAALVTIIDPYGAGAFFTAGRTSDWVNGNVTQPAVNIIYALHNNVHLPTAGPNAFWGSYWQAEKTATASAAEVFQLEASFQNLGASVLEDPFNVNASGSTHILRVDAGVGTVAGNPVSSALEILNNGNSFNSGIVFGNGSIATVSGHINAIQLPSGYEVAWYTSTGVIGGSVKVDSSSRFVLNSTFFNFGGGAPGFGFSVATTDGSNSQALFAGTTRGVRLYQSSSGSFIEGVDSTGVTTYQPLTVGGSALGFTISGTYKLDYGVTTPSTWTIKDPFVIANGSTFTGAMTLPDSSTWTNTGLSTGNQIIVSSAAKTLQLKQGANGAVGTFICTSGGDITVSNSNVAISDAIIISLNTSGGTISTPPAVKSISAGANFHALCATGDTSTYNYAIIKNAA
jgi:hypothetical protein